MAPFLMIFLITVLSVMYISKMIKYKFRDEKRPIWKIIHIISFIIGYIPILSVGYLLLIDESYLIEKVILVIILILLYLVHKKYKKKN